ncbi:serine-rich adhesin for platelets-like isoform X2 [Stegodyphus dumicola]|uniref:serine-rich adhesin for platelets-like isoform X2 n=1 Tax=Stegodyphus dumicola TaxID=202533 RepID=UPI0015A91B3E|nr:serine-rich adhesin for platelets-like isoform X2 [Stegodyphus dumicola]
MLLCVAGGSSAEFTRDRSRSGRCSSQSLLIQNNANQQVMVEERCSMTNAAVNVSLDHVTTQETLSFDLRASQNAYAKPPASSKESSVAYRSKVFVVRGEDSAFDRVPEKKETCSTTTTFKSNVVNGKRSTNTILVRYKPSKATTASSDDDVQFDFGSKKDRLSATPVSSSSSSTISTESSSSSKKEKASSSAWAQIMELEGYRSPAIGLDNAPPKQSDNGFCSAENASCESTQSFAHTDCYSCDMITNDVGNCQSKIPELDSNYHHVPKHCSSPWDEKDSCFMKHGSEYDTSECESLLSTSSSLNESFKINNDVLYRPNSQSSTCITPKSNNFDQIPTACFKSKTASYCNRGEKFSSNTSLSCASSTKEQIRMAQKTKSCMLRSESSRTPKGPSQDRPRNRRKTLPDGNLNLDCSDTSSLVDSQNKFCKNQSIEQDPNASWGRYNSRAMRDSVRKLAEKYAETVNLRRETHSKLDSLSGTKNVQLTRYVSPHDQNHVHSPIRTLYVQNNLYCPRIASSTSYLHEVHVESDSHRKNLHFIAPLSTHHNHSSVHISNIALKGTSSKLQFCKYNSEKNQIFRKTDTCNNDCIEVQSSGSDTSAEISRLTNTYSKDTDSSFFDKHEINEHCTGEENYQADSKFRTTSSRTKAFQTSQPMSNIQKPSVKSEQSDIFTEEAKEFAHLSAQMKDIKSKLCVDCAQSASRGPPSKQPALRTKQSKPQPKNSSVPDHISLLKRAPLVVYESDSNTPPYIKPLVSKKSDNASKYDNTFATRRCTMLTAREMADLVHGNSFGKINDTRLPQVSVTNKVTSWIQKQKDKRKPVFFIGDMPSHFTDNDKSSSCTVSDPKHNNRKSRRSLSLSNVREGEVSTNCSTISKNNCSINHSTLQLNAVPNSSDSVSNDHHYKGLFIKRASSSCSNRGSSRRKARQGSPAQETELFKKNRNSGRNQADGYIVSWSNRFQSKIKKDCHSSNNVDIDVDTESLKSEKGKNIYESEVILAQKSASLITKNNKSNYERETLDKFVRGQNKSFCKISGSVSETDSSEEGKRKAASDSSDQDKFLPFTSEIHFDNSELTDTSKCERSGLSKKLLNIKHLTRALSLHSLKKKSKELTAPVSFKANSESSPVVDCKLNTGSKRKIENIKYGSLRKSLSYSELTARVTKLSGKFESPLNVHTEERLPVAPSVTKFISNSKRNCSCSASLRRSVSLLWKFPLSRSGECVIEEPRGDLLARICFSRLYSRNAIPPFIRHLKIKSTTVKVKELNCVNDSGDHMKDEFIPPMDTHQKEYFMQPAIVSLDGKQDVSRAASDIGNSEDQQKNVTSLDQIWRANPVKLCRVHSRLLMCRHKGRYRLRRSISQPVELEMTGSIHNLRDSTHGSADHDSFQKGSLSSDDEASSESDIYHSYCCSPTRRSNTCWELSGEGTMYAEALWDHETLDSEELPFQAGDIIEVTDTSDHDWWWGTKDGNGGWFPSAFVRLYVNHRGPSLHFNGQQSEGIQIPYSPCKVSMNNLSCEQVRANIVQEIVATERDYVKHLKDVVEGYLKQVHRRPDMFSKERIETVFGNIKEIYNFQSQFLKQLEDRLDKDSPHLSQIGDIFLNHKEEFKMYSQYCNNHPLAVSELQELYCDSQYIHFFEACRLLQEMIDISLDGFLLTPIQRICKYPLQLAELLKFTDASHPDHIPVTNALAAMKDVAELVNERKRRMECLERIAEWQSTIEGWEGPDVLDTSSILIHCGEVTRVSSSWSRDIYLFIFDHQLIYCKKDLLKRHTYAYKGRLNLDYCDIVDAEDGKDSQFAVNVKNAWKIYCRDKDKWYLFYAKTSPEKDQWLRAFKAERQRVIDDENQAFVVTEEAKKSARLAVHNKQKPKRPRAKFTKGRRCHPDAAVTELLLDSPSAKARSGSLPSNIHPELAIMAGAKLGPTRKKGSGWFHFGSGKKPKS